MYKILVIVFVVIAVAGGAYIAGKNGLTISFNKATAVPIMTASSLPEATPSVNQVLPTATPLEEDELKAAVKAGLIAEHGQDAANMTITVSTIEGDYAKGMATEQAGGGIWFAAKVTGTWRLVWDGNGIIQCNDLASYPGFPSALIPECFDASTNQMVTR